MVHHQHQQQRRNGGGGGEPRRVEVQPQVARKRTGGGRPLMKMDRGYAVFAEEVRSNWQQHQPGVDFTYFQLAELCVEAWKEMTSEDRRPYRIRGEAKYTRYGKRIGTKTPVNGQQVSAVPNGIRARDAGFARRRLFVEAEAEPPTMQIVQKPKGASNSFFLFAKAERAKLAASKSKGKKGCGGVSSRLSNKQLGLMWQVADPETKAYYKELAKEDQDRYLQEYAVYQQQQQQQRRPGGN